MDLGQKTGHDQGRNLPPLDSRPIPWWAASPRDWLLVDHQAVFQLDLLAEPDLPAIVIPAQSKDPRGEKWITAIEKVWEALSSWQRVVQATSVFLVV